MAFHRTLPFLQQILLEPLAAAPEIAERRAPKRTPFTRTPAAQSVEKGTGVPFGPSARPQPFPTSATPAISLPAERTKQVSCVRTSLEKRPSCLTTLLQPASW